MNRTVYEIVKTMRWVLDMYVLSDGHAEVAYKIKKDGVLLDGVFSSIEKAKNYIDDCLTQSEEVVYTKIVLW